MHKPAAEHSGSRLLQNKHIFQSTTEPSVCHTKKF
jgi:hypothetical protein